MKAIVAMDLSRGIGYRNQIPWRLSEDMKWFRKMTMGGTVVMGNNTYSTVGELKGRFNYVLTNDSSKLSLLPTIQRQYVSLDSFLSLKKEEYDTTWERSFWVIGGAKIYKLLVPHCSEVYVTHVLNEYECDTYMPPFEHLFPNQKIIKESKDYWIVKYSK